MKLVILATGMGNRYGGLKQLDVFGTSSHSILEFSIYDALMSGFNEVIFIIRRDIEAEFKKFLLKTLPSSIQYKLAYQEINHFPPNVKIPIGLRKKPWGTAHAPLLC